MSDIYHKFTPGAWKSDLEMIQEAYIEELDINPCIQCMQGVLDKETKGLLISDGFHNPKYKMDINTYFCDTCPYIYFSDEQVKQSRAFLKSKIV